MVPSHHRFNIKFMISRPALVMKHVDMIIYTRAGTAWLHYPTFYSLGVVDSYTLRLTATVAYSFTRAFTNILSPN